MAIILPANDMPSLCTATSDPDKFGPDGMTLEVMQAIVGGYIEHVCMHPPAVINGVSYPHLVINELGKLEHLPLNKAATLYALRGGLMPTDHIVGPAIFLTDEEFQ